MPASATKTARTLQASTSNAAGATTTGTALDLTTKYGGLAQLTITNGATGPTVGCDAILEASVDNSTWYELGRATHGTSNNLAATYNFDVPPAVMHLRSKFTGNTGQAVTVVAVFHELTNAA
jgi:hypothetical protein